MKNDCKIGEIIEKIRYSTEEFLCLPNMCAYSDSIAEQIIAYSKELEKLVEEGFNDG
ncbi:MAG: hypothetical protein NC452_19865 [Eubacterium sp.]|nr:hypothetical protein [Eubacterium sp.]